MSEREREEFVDIRNSLLTTLVQCEERYKRGKQDHEQAAQIEVELIRLQQEYEDMKNTGNHMRDIYANIKSYAKNHADQAKAILDLAIEQAGTLVPDANCNGIHLSYTENNRVTVVNGKGQNVNLREGSGYRAILGVLLRYACIKAQPASLPLMLMDEYFFTLSDTTTQGMKDVLNAMKKDVTLVVIEQRRNAVDGILDAEYTFKKGDNGITKVSKTL